MSSIREQEYPGIDAAWGFYKRVVSPLLHALSPHGGGCLYQPTCSEYAALACAQHGVGRGGWMAAWRLLRCNPLSRGGWDPVPLSPHYRDKRLTRSQVP